MSVDESVLFLKYVILVLGKKDHLRKSWNIKYIYLMVLLKNPCHLICDIPNLSLIQKMVCGQHITQTSLKSYIKYGILKVPCAMLSLSVVSDSATPWTVACQALLSMGILQARIWSGLHALLQGIFPTQGSNPGLQHCRWILYCLSHWGSLMLDKLVNWPKCQLFKENKGNDMTLSISWYCPFHSSMCQSFPQNC